MKKIVIILMFSFIIVGCTNDEKNLSENSIENNLTNNLSANEEHNTLEKEEDTYIDNNPVKISIYAENDKGSLSKVMNKYEAPWQKKKDIVVLATLPTDIENPDYDYMPNMWPKYNAAYEGVDYKVGWNVSFKLKDGQEINSTLLKPSNSQSYYDYLEIYLYDDVNMPIGQWHSHLLDDEITENTIMDAIKLTAGEKYEEILEPITVTVFTYDGNDDFDDSGNYRGKSLYKVEIYNN